MTITLLPGAQVFLPRRRRPFLPRTQLLALLLLTLHGLCACLAADSTRSGVVPLSPRLAPIRIAPGLGFLESPPPRCAAPSAVCRNARVGFTPEQRLQLSSAVVPALLAAFARRPPVLQLPDGPAPPLPPATADVCRETGGSAAGVALYVAPLVGAGGAADVVRCAAAVVLRLRPDGLDASRAAAIASLLSKALEMDGCPDTDAVLLRGVSTGGDVRDVCVGLRCAAGERVQVLPMGATQWADCAEGLLPIDCPQYADVCDVPLAALKKNETSSTPSSAEPSSARKPVKKRFLSAFGESDGLTHTVKESAPPHAAENTKATKNDTANRTTRSTKSKAPDDTRIRFQHAGASDSSNAITLITPWVLLMLFLVIC